MTINIEGTNFDEGLRFRYVSNCLEMLGFQTYPKRSCMTGVTNEWVGRILKIGAEPRYGVDWSAFAFDVFFLADDVLLSEVLPASFLFELLLFGRDPLA